MSTTRSSRSGTRNALPKIAEEPSGQKPSTLKNPNGGQTERRQPQQQTLTKHINKDNDKSKEKQPPTPTALKTPYNTRVQDVQSILKNNKTSKRSQYQQSLRRDTNRIYNRNRTTPASSRERHLTKQATTTYRSRATLKLNIPASDNPLRKAISIIKDFISQLQESDENACIIPWLESDIPTTSIIEDATDVPSRLDDLLIFHPKIYAGRPQQQNITYVKVHIGHEEKFESINTDIKYWLMSGNHGLYYNMLQAETTEKIGWLLYSTKSIDAGALAEDLYDKFEIQVGLRWMTIDAGTKGKMPNDKKVFALHVEAIRSEKNTVKKALLKLYSRTSWANSNDLPNGVRLRFVTLRREATSTHSITKLDRLRHRQKGFLAATIRSEPNWDILHLDWRLRDKTPTLREMIMNIKSATHETTLFLSVDLDWMKSGFVFQYLPELQEEAASMTRTLYPYLLWELDKLREDDYDPDDEYDIEPLRADELQKFFDADALLRMEDLKYDPVKKTVVDKYVDTYLEFIDDEDLLGNKFDIQDEDQINNPHPTRPEPKPLTSNVFREGDNDTVSTLGASVHTSISGRTRNKIRKVRLHSTTDDHTTNSSTGSTVSTESYLTLESKVNTMSTKFDLQLEKMDNLMKLFTASNKSNTDETSQPPSGIKDAGGAEASAGERR